MLHLCMVPKTHAATSGEPIPIPYQPSMLFCDYLRTIIAPAAKLRLDLHATSTLELVHFNGLAFDYANRLERVGKHIPEGAYLTVLPFRLDTRPKLIGNASRADIKADCPMCLEPSTNFTIGCHHRFHDTCLFKWQKRTCPMCRTNYSAVDKERLQVSIIDGVKMGRLPPNHPIVIEILDD